MADGEPERRGEGGKRNTTIKKMTSRVLEISSISVSMREKKCQGNSVTLTLALPLWKTDERLYDCYVQYRSRPGSV